MKIRECTACKTFAEESDTERIQGKYYCYKCFDFCRYCNKPHQLNDLEEGLCKKCRDDV